jgi:hypothetical protein
MSSFDLISLLLVTILTVTGVAKVFALAPMRAAAAHAGFSVAAYRAIGSLELAAVVGLALGNWAPPLGAAAASGVLVLMVGAVVVHARAGDSAYHWLPAIASGALAVSYAALVTGAIR